MGTKVPVLAGIILVIGIIVLVYPEVSSYLAKRQQENVIVGYETKIVQLDKNILEEEWEKAKIYNENPHAYENVLNIEGNGVMGYIEIPKIDVLIPIYHGSTEESLKKGIGHMKETGLPIGGNGNHPVLTGHRGVPGNELFTRLDELEIGDTFSLHVLNKILTYKVRRIRVVLPEKIRTIEEEKGKDLVTLVTCTPYGVNTHRLLIEGERTYVIEKINEKKNEENKKRNNIIIYIMILLTGIGVLLYPYASQKMYYHNVKRQKVVFIKECSQDKIRTESLYRELKKQNNALYMNGQEKLNSVSAYEKPAINLRLYGINNDVIGYISIPEIKVSLPILLGANEENMKKGAVHLTETSYPIGGSNTNCVIAAHRGYSKAAMFREIEKLKPGNQVIIRNFKGRLVYKVTDTQVIDPSNVDEILIREGKDMLTLITCHPYRKNFQRYVVFCERV